jgi:sterol desaturase/sphingolipid hydroxylase (fatty acid hydroxylase superfamily)
MARLAMGAGGATRWCTVLAGALLVASVWTRPDVAAALVVLGAPFVLIERWRPLRAQPSAPRRIGAATDATGFVVDEVIAALGLAAVLVVVLPAAGRIVPPEVPRHLSAQPGWLRWVEACVISEISGYWGHRLSHEVPTLWRFHRVHHSAPQLDWLAPNRRHPIDVIVARTSTSVPVLMLGFSVPTVVTYFALKRIQGLFVHANVNLRFGALERVVATPFFHHWHHSDEPGTWNKNYAGSLPAVDWLFGTLHLPDRWPAAYGCDGAVPDTGYVARLLSPWRTGPEQAAVEPNASMTRGAEPPRCSNPQLGPTEVSGRGLGPGAVVRRRPSTAPNPFPARCRSSAAGRHGRG